MKVRRVRVHYGKDGRQTALVTVEPEWTVKKFLKFFRNELNDFTYNQLFLAKADGGPVEFLTPSCVLCKVIDIHEDSVRAMDSRIYDASIQSVSHEQSFATRRRGAKSSSPTQRRRAKSCAKSRSRSRSRSRSPLQHRAKRVIGRDCVRARWTSSCRRSNRSRSCSAPSAKRRSRCDNEDLAKSSQQDLVRIWRAVAKGKGRKVCTAAVNYNAALVFEPNLTTWLKHRQLDAILRRVPSEDIDAQPQWIFFKYEPEFAVVAAQSHWLPAYHGTWWYALRNILETGVLLQSESVDAGHEFSQPGFYCSPLHAVAAEYARPHVVFNDNVYHRVMLSVLYDPEQLIPQKSKIAQLVLPCRGVALTGVFFQPNSPPSQGEERLDWWSPRLEA